MWEVYPGGISILVRCSVSVVLDLSRVRISSFFLAYFSNVSFHALQLSLVGSFNHHDGRGSRPRREVKSKFEAVRGWSLRYVRRVSRRLGPHYAR